MTNIIDNILKDKSISSQLENYTYVSTPNWEEIPLGSHIKFIDRNEKLKSGGFLIKCVKNNDRTKCYYILKSNIIYKLYMYYYWIFYKNITHESKISKKIKLYKNTLNDNEINDNYKVEKLETKKIIINSNENKDLKINKKISSKRETFLSLLNSLDNLKK
jgi:hypothetical protein